METISFILFSDLPVQKRVKERQDDKVRQHIFISDFEIRLNNI